MRHFIIYGTVSRIPRRVIKTTDQFNSADHLQAGESYFEVFPSQEDIFTVEYIRQKVADYNKITVEEIETSRCAKVHNESGIVVECLHADPQIDSIAGHSLIQSDIACHNWKYDANIGFQRRMVAFDAAQKPVQVTWSPVDEVQLSSMAPKNNLVLQASDVEWVEDSSSILPDGITVI